MSVMSEVSVTLVVLVMPVMAAMCVMSVMFGHTGVCEQLSIEAWAAQTACPVSGNYLAKSRVCAAFVPNSTPRTSTDRLHPN